MSQNTCGPPTYFIYLKDIHLNLNFAPTHSQHLAKKPPAMPYISIHEPICLQIQMREN